MKHKAPSNKTLNKKIKHIENNLLELKYNDTAIASTAIEDTGFSVYLTDVAQGDTASDRDGNVITPTLVQLRFTFANAALNITDGARIRYILFWDRQPNGAVPVLVGASTTQSLLDTGTIADPMMAPRNFNTIHRYKILMDRLLDVNPQLARSTTIVAAVTTLTDSVILSIMKSHVVKLGRQVKYNNTSAAITAAVSNALHIAFYSDSAGANDPTIQGGVRLYYRDS